MFLTMISPQSAITIHDYGFEGAELEERIKILGLHIGLVKVLGVTSKTLHTWQ
jgi:hypothetical protein